jgi:hypothetical protein
VHVRRERKRIAAEELGAKAEALQQRNSYLKALLENKDLEKQLLARWRPISLPANLQKEPDALLWGAPLQGADQPRCSALLETMLCSGIEGCAWCNSPEEGHSCIVRLFNVTELG